MMQRISQLLIILVGAAPMLVHAADPGIPAVTVQTQPDGSETYTLSIQILILMTLITLLPAALMMLTAFTRIVIVLSILRQV